MCQYCRMKQYITLAALIAASALVACGGSPSPAESVAICGAQILPRVLACIPADYRGVHAEPLRQCIASVPDLRRDIRQCRDDGPGEFSTFFDHRIGHQARVLLESIAESSPSERRFDGE
jgi:hypothetical protein